MFKHDFKYYKSRNPLPSFQDVLNFNQPDLTKVITVNPRNLLDKFFGLKPIEQWNIYEIINRPGLIFINNPFTSLGQRYWITRSLKDYSKGISKTNLDVQNIIPENVGWWDYCHNNIETSALKKLRWATLGYHHDWDTKVYSEDGKGIFPTDLSLLCNYIAIALGFVDFKAEAAIINYYHMDSTLSGHTDHSEQNLEAPLFSLSFGQTALFLIGGTTIDIKPTALFLHSGDVVILSNDARLAYHGVPRILHADTASWCLPCELRDDDKIENFEEDNLKICWTVFGDGCELLNLRPIVSHTCPIGNKSGEGEGRDGANKPTDNISVREVDNVMPRWRYSDDV
ncbi:putative 2OG-Fe(II) oxygenase superfamily [Trypoxylus dichotomus]